MNWSFAPGTTISGVVLGIESFTQGFQDGVALFNVNRYSSTLALYFLALYSLKFLGHMIITLTSQLYTQAKLQCAPPKKKVGLYAYESSHCNNM